MKFIKKAFLIFITLSILSCGKNDEKEKAEPAEPLESKEITKTNNNNVVDTLTIDSVRATKESVLRSKNYKKKTEVNSDDLKLANKKTTFSPSKKVAARLVLKNENSKKSSTTKLNSKVESNNNLSFFYLKKILKDCEIGEVFTQKQLSKNYQIPKDAIALIKSIKKISDNEVDVKWHSTWFIEELSDAKFNDGKLKIHFKGDNMYTSGDAIAIKYDRKIYTDLVITGHIARIPTVKGYYWQIGKE